MTLIKSAYKIFLEFFFVEHKIFERTSKTLDLFHDVEFCLSIFSVCLLKFRIPEQNWRNFFLIFSRNHRQTIYNLSVGELIGCFNIKFIPNNMKSCASSVSNYFIQNAGNNQFGSTFYVINYPENCCRYWWIHFKNFLDIQKKFVMFFNNSFELG